MTQTTTTRRRAATPWGEWAITAVLILLGVVVLLDGLGQPTSRSASGIGAGLLPIAVGLLLLALGAAVAIQVARGHVGEPESAEGDVDVRTTQWVPMAVVVAAGLVFIGAVEPLGYVITSTVVFWIVAWAMGARKHLQSALVALALSLVVYLVFTRLLSISLPAGLLEGFL